MTSERGAQRAAAPAAGGRAAGPRPRRRSPSGRAEPSPGPAGPSNHSERLTALLVPPSGVPRVDRGRAMYPGHLRGHRAPWCGDRHPPARDRPAHPRRPRHRAARGPLRVGPAGAAVRPRADAGPARRANRSRRRDGGPRRRRGCAERRRAGRAARGRGLEDLLARIAWPEQVAGCALAVERIVVPPEAERELPDDDAAALRAVAEHPGRADVRLLVAVTRDGSARCLLRQRDHDSDDRVALGDDIAPGPRARPAGDLQRPELSVSRRSAGRPPCRCRCRARRPRPRRTSRP